jgi:GLPGLI family protein
MNINKNAFLIIFLIIANMGFSQVSDMYNVIYELNYKLDKEQNKYWKEYFDLVGNSKKSVFESQSNFISDSLMDNSKNVGTINLSSLPKTNFESTIHKNVDGIVYNSTFDGVKNYQYYESPEFNWVSVKDSVKVIKNLTCQLATTNYGGRKWFAWYTLEIPISDGPFKFKGLPGLIIEAYDSEKDYVYTLYGYTLNSTRDLTYRSRDKQGELISREDFLKLRLKLKSSLSESYKASGVVVQMDPVEERKLNKRLSRQVNFIELE